MGNVEDGSDERPKPIPDRTWKGATNRSEIWWRRRPAGGFPPIWEQSYDPQPAAQMNRTLTPSERRKRDQLHARRIEKTLDAGAGECFLRNPAIGRIVANALKEFDGSRYWLFAWCVMPNHVHVLFQTIGKTSLADILHSWKSYSAKAANHILGRNGEFWQREYHDHLIRDVAEFDRAGRYIVENPSRAGLKNWPWVWSWK